MIWEGEETTSFRGRGGTTTVTTALSARYKHIKPPPKKKEKKKKKEHYVRYVAGEVDCGVLRRGEPAARAREEAQGERERER